MSKANLKAIKTAAPARLAEVVDIHRRPNRAVIAELSKLLMQASNGELIGIAYSAETNERIIRAGMAGTLARDKMAAASAYFVAAVEVARKCRRDAD